MIDLDALLCDRKGKHSHSVTSEEKRELVLAGKPVPTCILDSERRTSFIPKSRHAYRKGNANVSRTLSLNSQSENLVGDVSKLTIAGSPSKKGDEQE